MMMTPDQVEDLVERTANRTAEKIREEVRGMFTALGFNMDPDEAHEEQQMIAFIRSLHLGARKGAMAFFTGTMTTIAGLIVAGLWYFFGSRHP